MIDKGVDQRSGQQSLVPSRGELAQARFANEREFKSALSNWGIDPATVSSIGSFHNAPAVGLYYQRPGEGTLSITTGGLDVFDQIRTGSFIPTTVNPFLQHGSASALSGINLTTINPDAGDFPATVADTKRDLQAHLGTLGLRPRLGGRFSQDEEVYDKTLPNRSKLYISVERDPDNPSSAQGDIWVESAGEKTQRTFDEVFESFSELKALITQAVQANAK